MFEADDFKPEETVEQPQATQDQHYKELYLRTNADFQNFKRRVERERTELTQLIQANVLEKLLPTVDDLQRAIKAAETTSEAAAWLDGFKLILKNLQKTLSELGIEEIVATGAFNPEFHEALMHVESPEHKSGQIVQELSKGYSLKGKVIKHARVSVAK